MQTRFSEEQRAEPQLAASEKAIRTCVHCGFCLATCPTYVLLGDELDSPRGRIYQMKEMLESGEPPSPVTVRHIDRCLSCLACMTTCPSGVNYMRLVDHARAYIEARYVRPWPDRLSRAFLAFVLPRKTIFRGLLRLGSLARPFAGVMPGRLRTMVSMAPRRLPARDPAEEPQVFSTRGKRRGRVALLVGCVQPVLAPQINAATIRLFNRLGMDVIVARGIGCCGALPHHLGKVDQSHAMAKANIEVWMNAAAAGELDAIVVTASGCGTTVKDYGVMLADDPVWAARAARVAALAKDVTEVLAERQAELPLKNSGDLLVAYQSACSLQHGQKVTEEPVSLLRTAGYKVVEPQEGHLCCGSAGTYNLLQPEIAGQLQRRKAVALEATGADVIATGNVGCMAQIAAATAIPVVHTIELLDWAAGGPTPSALESRRRG